MSSLYQYVAIELPKKLPSHSPKSSQRPCYENLSSLGRHALVWMLPKFVLRLVLSGAISHGQVLCEMCLIDDKLDQKGFCILILGLLLFLFFFPVALSQTGKLVCTLVFPFGK